jgi:hypothetical protein
MSMLCTLTDVKTLLGITDTAQDAKLTLFIKGVSSQIEGYIGYSLGMADYTEEVHNVNNRQLMQLNHFPIRTVSSVTLNGAEIDDYKIIEEYARWGLLYRGNGWGGRVYTQTFEHDVVSGAYDYNVSYKAGYYLPGDTGYTEGAIDSLPYDIYSACLALVCQKYTADVNGAIGIKAHSEGGISDTYGDASTEIGLTDSMKKTLSKYVWYGVA